MIVVVVVAVAVAVAGAGVVVVVVVVVGSTCVCRRRAGCAISLLACAETRVLALCSPAIELAFCFRIGFCGVF